MFSQLQTQEDARDRQHPCRSSAAGVCILPEATKDPAAPHPNGNPVQNFRGVWLRHRRFGFLQVYWWCGFEAEISFRHVIELFNFPPSTSLLELESFAEQFSAESKSSIGKCDLIDFIC